ncbi:hypothetical protein [Providencia sp. PROV255]|uniref:hypothetical protein n=1 Tax=Providencia sp. PROV255 TaxID=2949943 RepID=UPI00234B3F29|nr:hypothetical protein [Providencia sp. PROV255]
MPGFLRQRLGRGYYDLNTKNYLPAILQTKGTQHEKDFDRIPDHPGDGNDWLRFQT